MEQIELTHSHSGCTSYYEVTDDGTRHHLASVTGSGVGTVSFRIGQHSTLLAEYHAAGDDSAIIAFSQTFDATPTDPPPWADAPQPTMEQLLDILAQFEARK